MRICFFGDSFVNGTGDAAALGWPGRLMADARREGRDLTFYNLGIRRDTSADIAGRWREEAARRLPDGAPRRLAFGFGTNDCAESATGGPRLARDVALGHARAILAEARAVAPTLLVGPPPVLDDPVVDARVEALSGDLAALCADLGVPFLPTFAFVSGCAPWRAEAAAGDGTHPGAAGYGALAAHIGAWPAFRRWLDGA